MLRPGAWVMSQRVRIPGGLNREPQTKSSVGRRCLLLCLEGPPKRSPPTPHSQARAANGKKPVAGAVSGAERLPKVEKGPGSAGRRQDGLWTKNQPQRMPGEEAGEGEDMGPWFPTQPADEGISGRESCPVPCSSPCARTLPAQPGPSACFPRGTRLMGRGTGARGCGFGCLQDSPEPGGGVCLGHANEQQWGPGPGRAGGRELRVSDPTYPGSLCQHWGTSLCLKELCRLEGEWVRGDGVGGWGGPNSGPCPVGPEASWGAGHVNALRTSLCLSPSGPATLWGAGCSDVPAVEAGWRPVAGSRSSVCAFTSCHVTPNVLLKSRGQGSPWLEVRWTGFAQGKPMAEACRGARAAGVFADGDGGSSPRLWRRRAAKPNGAGVPGLRQARPGKLLPSQP